MIVTTSCSNAADSPVQSEGPPADTGVIGGAPSTRPESSTVFEVDEYREWWKEDPPEPAPDEVVGAMVSRTDVMGEPWEAIDGGVIVAVPAQSWDEFWAVTSAGERPAGDHNGWLDYETVTFRLDDIPTVSGVSSDIEQGWFHLRPLSSGPHLLCYLPDGQEPSNGRYQTFGCWEMDLEVPGHIQAGVGGLVGFTAIPFD